MRGVRIVETKKSVRMNSPGRPFERTDGAADLSEQCPEKSVFLQIALMVLFGSVKFRRRCNLGHDNASVSSGILQPFPRHYRCGFLSLIKTLEDLPCFRTFRALRVKNWRGRGEPRTTEPSIRVHLRLHLRASAVSVYNQNPR